MIQQAIEEYVAKRLQDPQLAVAYARLTDADIRVVR
jgi:hypothetical protein